MERRGARLGQLILWPWNNVIHHITARPYWPVRSISRVKYHQLTWYNSFWLWRCLLYTCRLSKRLSLSTTVLWWQDQTLTILVVFFTAPRVFMLFSTTTDIRRILFNSSDNLEVVLPVRGLTDVRAIDYDVNSHLIYWIDSAAKEIRRSFQNGSNAKTIVLGEDSSPYDLAIDSYGQQLFWTDSVKNSINVYSLRKGVSMGVVFHESGVHPRSIVLYPERGWVNSF